MNIDDLKKEIHADDTRTEYNKKKSYNQAIDDMYAQGLLMVWRPIETAPIDMVAIFTNGKHTEISAIHEINEIGCCFDYDKDVPTNWMPSPPLPKGDV